MIRRKILDHLREHLTQPEITLLSGARQVGKTTLMNILMDELREKREMTLSLSMDFESDKPFFASQEALINRIRLEFGDQHGFVFMDEIQRKENAGLFLKGLYDMRLPVKFIISGSGSIELKERISESLAGRKRIFELTPVTFPEFIDFRTGYNYIDKLASYVNLFPEKSLGLLYEYLNFGGYPRVVTAPTVHEKMLMINEIYQSYIDRDIRPLIRGDRPEAFGRLIRLLAGQTGQMINLSRLAMDSQLSVPGLQKHLWVAEKTFLIKLITPFFNNVTKEITKSPVVYFNDHGMRNFVISAFGNLQRPQDSGFVFQNLIGNTLLHELSGTPFRVHFWRTTDRAEVDFVIARSGDPIPVEVKFSSFKKPSITRSLRSFISKYKPSEAWIVNLTFTEKIEIDNTTIRFVSFYDLQDVLKNIVSSIERNYLAEERVFPYRIK